MLFKASELPETGRVGIRAVGRQADFAAGSTRSRRSGCSRSELRRERQLPKLIFGSSVIAESKTTCAARKLLRDLLKSPVSNDLKREHDRVIFVDILTQRGITVTINGGKSICLPGQDMPVQASLRPRVRRSNKMLRQFVLGLGYDFEVRNRLRDERRFNRNLGALHHDDTCGGAVGESGPWSTFCASVCR